MSTLFELAGYATQYIFSIYVFWVMALASSLLAALLLLYFVRSFVRSERRSFVYAAWP